MRGHRPRVNVERYNPKEADVALSDQMTALSDKLSELSARAKEAEAHAAAARDKSKADVQADVKTARASAQDRANKLRESAEANKNKLSVWWNDLQRTWNEHVAKIREDIDTKRGDATWIEPSATPSTKLKTRRSRLSSHTPRSKRQSTQCSMPNWHRWRRTSARPPEQFWGGRPGPNSSPRASLAFS